MMEYERLHLDHPMSYFFIIEMQGPKNCLLRTYKNNVEYSKSEGTSPCSLYLEFRSYLKYVTQKPCSSNNFEADTDTPTIYKATVENQDFSENSELESIYHSERDKTFNVDYNQLKKGLSKIIKLPILIVKKSFTNKLVSIAILLLNYRKDFRIINYQ